MAQLVKLSHYISRYQKDPYRYTGQFIRQKKRKWQTLLKDERLNSLGRKELQDHFYKKLFQNQLIWASSTPTMRSECEETYKEDKILKHLLKKNRRYGFSLI